MALLFGEHIEKLGKESDLGVDLSDGSVNGEGPRAPSGAGHPLSGDPLPWSLVNIVVSHPGFVRVSLSEFQPHIQRFLESQ